MFLLSNKFVYRLKLFFALFISSLVLSYWSVYIPYLSITISLESFTLLLTGFLFGSVVGFCNGLAVDLITFPWGGGYSPSIWFLLQPALIGCLGGINFKEWSKTSLNTLLIIISIVFPGLYCLLFSELIQWLIFYPIINLLIIYMFGKNVNLLRWFIVLNLSIYICSFGVGTLGSMFTNPLASPLLFLRVRTLKEIIKLVLFGALFGAFRRWVS